MSDVFTKRRPMIDWDELESRLCWPCSPDEKDDDPLAELLRVIGGKDESHETDFEPNTPLSARARQDAGESGELNQPGCASAPHQRRFRCDRGRVAGHEAATGVRSYPLTEPGQFDILTIMA